MPLPGRHELRLAFLQVLSDGEFHTHQQIADALAAEYQLTDELRYGKRGHGKQSPLDNEINWLKGNELHTQLKLIEYNEDKTAMRITDSGMKVLQAKPDKELSFDFVRQVLGH